MEQCIAALAVCFFCLGVICDRLAIWFYNNYIASDDDDDQLTENPNRQEAI